MADKVTQEDLYSDELQEKADKGEFTLEDYRAAREDGLLSHPLSVEAEKEEEPGDGKPGGKDDTHAAKPGEGKETPKGAPEQAAKPEDGKETPKGETAKPEGKAKPGPVEQFADQQRTAREQRRQEREQNQDKTRIQELERRLAEKTGSTGGQEVTGLTEEPKEDDPKYAGDIEALWDDLDKWEAQGKKPVEIQPAGETAVATKPPEKSRAEQMHDGIYEALDRADAESKLTADFKQGVTSGSIELSGEILTFLDQPDTPDYIIEQTARLFLEKPSLSGRIARRGNGTHRELLLKVLTEREQATNPQPKPAEEPFEALVGAGAEVKGQDIADLLESDDPEKYQKYRAYREGQGKSN